MTFIHREQQLPCVLAPDQCLKVILSQWKVS